MNDLFHPSTVTEPRQRIHVGHLFHLFIVSDQLCFGFQGVQRKQRHHHDQQQVHDNRIHDLKMLHLPAGDCKRRDMHLRIEKKADPERCDQYRPDDLRHKRRISGHKDKDQHHEAEVLKTAVPSEPEDRNRHPDQCKIDQDISGKPGMCLISQYKCKKITDDPG